MKLSPLVFWCVGPLVSLGTLVSVGPLVRYSIGPLVSDGSLVSICPMVQYSFGPLVSVGFTNRLHDGSCTSDPCFSMLTCSIYVI